MINLFSKYPAQFTVLIIFTLQLINGFFILELHKYSPALFWLYDIFQFVLLPLILLVALSKYFKLKPSNYGIIIPKTTDNYTSFILVIVYCTLLLQLFSFVSYEATKAFYPAISYKNYHSVIPSGIFEIPAILYMSASAAIVEEIIYRGLPLIILKNIINERKLELIYIFSTASIFALVHWENNLADIVSSFVYGVIAATLYLQYKNLIPIIFAHFTIDLVIFW